MKLILAIALLGVAMADYNFQKPVGHVGASDTDDKRPDSREGDGDDFPTSRDGSYGAPDTYKGHYEGASRGSRSRGYQGHQGQLDNVHNNDEQYYRRYGDQGNDAYPHVDRIAMVGDMTAEYQVELGWRWSCEADTYFADSINVRVMSDGPAIEQEYYQTNHEPKIDGTAMIAAQYCNFDFEGCRRVCEEFAECSGFDIRSDPTCATGDVQEVFTQEPREQAEQYATVCTLKTEDDTMDIMKKSTESGDFGVTCTRTRGSPSRDCPEDMALVPFYVGQDSLDIANPSDGNLCIDWTTPVDFEEYTALIGQSNRKHHNEPMESRKDQERIPDAAWRRNTAGPFPGYYSPLGDDGGSDDTVGYHNQWKAGPVKPFGEQNDSDRRRLSSLTGYRSVGPSYDREVRTPWGVIDTRVRKTDANWPLVDQKLVTWRKTFGQGGRSCRDDNVFTKSDCKASQYAAAVVCERRGLTLCTTEQYQAFADWQNMFKRGLSFTDDAKFKTSSPRDDTDVCIAESYDEVDNYGLSEGCNGQENEAEIFAYKCCEEFRHKHVQVDGYVLQHDHIVDFRVNSTDIMRHNHFDARFVDTANGKSMSRGGYWIHEKMFRPHTHYAMDGTRFSHRHYTTFGDGHQHDRRWDILYGHDGQGHAQGHSYNGLEGEHAAGYDYNFGYDARQGYARGDYGDGHVHSEQHGHAHDGHDPDGQNYGPGFRTSHSHSQYDIHGFGHAPDLGLDDINHEVHYVAQ